MGTHTDGHTQTDTHRQTHTDRHTQTDTPRQTHTDRHTQTDTHRQTHTDRHTQTDTHRQTHTDTSFFRGFFGDALGDEVLACRGSFSNSSSEYSLNSGYFDLLRIPNFCRRRARFRGLISYPSASNALAIWSSLRFLL